MAVLEEEAERWKQLAQSASLRSLLDDAAAGASADAHAVEGTLENLIIRNVFMLRLARPVYLKKSLQHDPQKRGRKG